MKIPVMDPSAHVHFSGYGRKEELLDHKDAQWILFPSCTNLYSQQDLRVSTAPYPHQHLLLSDLLVGI